MKKFLFIIFSFLLVACTQTVELQLESEVDVYVNNEDEKGINLTSDDDEYIELNQWLIDNQSEWYSTSGRYPGGIYIKSGSYGIQVTKTQVVLYSTTGPELNAINIQNLNKGELVKLRKMGQ